MRHDLTDASVKRIAKSLIAATIGGSDWDSAIDALRAEDYANPERKVESLIHRLASLGYPHLAVSLGASAAYQAQDARRSISTFRSAIECFLDRDYTRANDKAGRPGQLLFREESD